MADVTWLYLPTAFVMGMAHALEPGHSKTLIAVGIAVCHGVAFFSKRATESKWTKRLPLISAGIVTLLGFLILVKGCSVMDIRMQERNRLSRMAVQPINVTVD